MQTSLPAIGRLILLAGWAYLGFYVFGVVMDVFAPGEIAVFTVIAALVVVATVVYVVRTRRGVEDPEEHRERMREQHALRERRGY